MLLLPILRNQSTYIVSWYIITHVATYSDLLLTPILGNWDRLLVNAILLLSADLQHSLKLNGLMLKACCFSLLSFKLQLWSLDHLFEHLQLALPLSKFFLVLDHLFIFELVESEFMSPNLHVQLFVLVNQFANRLQTFFELIMLLLDFKFKPLNQVFVHSLNLDRLCLLTIAILHVRLEPF